MSTIVIKDLPESVDLDRQAMKSVIGGARTAGRQGVFGRAVPSSDRIFDYPHFGRKLASGDRTRSGPGKSK